MKIEVNVRKKYFLTILATILVLAGGIVVWAYNSNPAEPAKFGHTANEVHVTVGGQTLGLQDAITQGKIGGTVGGTPTPVSTLGDSKCTARGGIATGTFADDRGYSVHFSPPFPTGVKPIVTITPDITSNPTSGTTALSVISNVDRAGFVFQTQAPLTYMHYVAYDPVCFSAPPANGGTVNAGEPCGVNDCVPGEGGRLMCVNGKWTFQAGSYQCL